MLKPALFSGMAALAVVYAVPAGAQITPEHVTVGCIVAEKYPKITSCFNPASALARARVYFRADGTTNWYFVEMKSDAPCFAGILPRPKKDMIGKKIDYYVEALDKTFAPARTPEAQPEVVASESACKKDTPVAPVVSKASVVVGSAAAGAPFPAAFVAAGSSLTVPLVVAGAAVVGGGAAVIASNNNDTTTTTTTPVGVTNTTTLPATTVPVTAPPTTAPRGQACRLAFTIDPNPTVGPDPLTVTFDGCASTGGTIKWTYDFEGDGIVDLRGGTSACHVVRRYTLDGVTPAAAAPTTVGPPPSKTYHPVVTGTCVDQGITQTETYDVTVTPSGFTVSAADQRPAQRRLSWVSQLDVADARGQVVVNGESVVYTDRGRSAAAVVGRRGENRLEAQVVQGSGKPGTWRLDLSGTASLVKGSLRVIAGDVQAIGGDSVIFRVSGKPGERVVLAFRTEK